MNGAADRPCSAQRGQGAVGRRRSASRDRGAVGAVEVLLAVPITLLMFVSVFQAALCWHARNIVEAAAQEGARRASAANGGCQEGTRRAASMVVQLGGAYVHAPTVTCADGPVVRVEVRADAFSLMPGIDFPVAAASVAFAPKER